MRRKYEKYKIREKTSYIFWNRCGCCKDDVKREPMWERYTYCGYSGDTIYDYFCQECFPTKENLIAWLERPVQPPKER